MALISLSLSSHALDVLCAGINPRYQQHAYALQPSSGLSEGDGSIATRSHIATVTDAVAAAGSPSVIGVIAAGLSSRSREFSAVAGCFLLATRTKQFIFLHSCIID